MVAQNVLKKFFKEFIDNSFEISRNQKLKVIN